MKALSAILIVVAFIAGAPMGTAHAEGRFALLIGNQGYNDKVGPLKNPHNDIALVGAALERLGFKVTLIKDAGYKAIDTALKTHIQQVRKAGKDAISLLYYSGHGASDPDTQINYLIPIDVEGADDTSLWTNSLELGDIVKKLRDQSPDATHYVIFDACRDELRLTREGKKALGTEKGFVPVGNVAGVMVAYATAPGRTASDAGQGAGPYARALSEEIIKPGVEAVTMFRNVQLRVKRAIGQDPWLSFPTLPAIYFAGSAADEQVELTHWTSVKDSTSPTVLATYLQRYPSGQFASLARALIEHYEQQRKAEEAAREEQRKRREEADKAAEVKRLEDERQARETALADERRRTGSGKSSADIKRQSEQEQAEMLAAQEKLRGALEEARIAREAAKRAEEERLAAVKAAEEATKAAEEAIARRRDTDATNDQVRLAALPKLEKPPGKDQFDGTWSVRRTADPGKCKFPIHSFTLTITNGAIRGSSGGTGSISVSGAGSWIGYAPTDGAPTRFQGTFRGNSGSGRFTRTTDDRCSGTFIARRN